MFGARKHWAHRFGTAPFLPTSRAEMDELGWGEPDIVLVTGDAYIDHPSFGMALIGRVLEAQGFRVAILAQPDWRSVDAFREFGRPAVCWGVTPGNMDSMVNRFTSERRIRSDDAYSPDGAAGLRPDRSVTVYAQRCREAYRDVPLVIGGIEASLRRIAHYDYWSDQVRRSVLLDAKADLLVFGMGERPAWEIARRLAAGEKIADLTDIRGTAHVKKNRRAWEPLLADATVKANVALGLRFRGVPGERIERQSGRWLARLAIAGFADRSARTLSGGEAQRVALARALVLEPELLLLDEPFSALDQPSRELLIGDPARILREDHVSTVLVTHDRAEAMTLGDRVGVMIAGRLVQLVDTAQIFRAPASEESARFVGSDTILD